MEATFTGQQILELASDKFRKLRLKIVSDGIAIMGENAEGYRHTIYVGGGKADIRVRTDANRLYLMPSNEMEFTISIPELRDNVAGWRNEPSLTDLTPKPVGTISPEIAAIMEQMNRNAIIREQKMLKALGQRQQ